MDKLRRFFPDFEPKLLAEMAEKGQTMRVAAGENLMRSGQPIRSTMLVLDGLVKLFREGEDGEEFFMYHLAAGEACALSMVCDRSFRASAITARAATDAELLVLPIDATEKWMRDHRSWYFFVVETYRKRYLELLETIDHIAFRNMDERLEFYLRRHRDESSSPILKMSNAEIAQELNSSREVISRLMKKLAEQGKVRLLKTGVEVLMR